MSLADLANYSHPTPCYSVTVDGNDITSTLQGRLIELAITDNRGFEADTVEIHLDDTDGQLSLPPRGSTISVSIGWADSGLVSKGSFTVDEVEHSGAPDTLSIRARSADLRTGLTTQRERSWHNVTLGDIIKTIADENDLTPTITSALSSQTIDHIDQTNESAVNLLTRLANQFDAIATIKNGKLLFLPAAGGYSASGLTLPTISITRESGDQHRFSIADRDAYTGVKATYNDINAGVKGEIIWGKDEDAAERNKSAKTTTTSTTTGQYKSLTKTYKTRGTALTAARKEWLRLVKNKVQKAAYVGVKAKYNDRNLSVSSEVSYGQDDEDKKRKRAIKQAQKDREKTSATDLNERPLIASDDNIKVLRHVYATKETATRGARAAWRKLQRGMANFSITLAKGRADLFPDIPVTVSGFKPEIDNTDWILTKVTHSLNESGYTTGIDLEIKATEVSVE